MVWWLQILRPARLLPRRWEDLLVPEARAREVEA